MPDYFKTLSTNIHTEGYQRAKKKAFHSVQWLHLPGQEPQLLTESCALCPDSPPLGGKNT